MVAVLKRNVNEDTVRDPLEDLDYIHYKRTMSKIARFAYKWVSEFDK